MRSKMKWQSVSENKLMSQRLCGEQRGVMPNNGIFAVSTREKKLGNP